jgi:hypothetical protein
MTIVYTKSPTRLSRQSGREVGPTFARRVGRGVPVERPGPLWAHLGKSIMGSDRPDVSALVRLGLWPVGPAQSRTAPTVTMAPAAFKGLV